MRHSLNSAPRLILAAFALSSVGIPALAQTEEEAIVVEAPREIPVPVERNPYTGGATAVTTVRMPVLYGDLDLTTAKDADRLMVRINRVAQDLCTQLDRLMPLDTPDPDCVSKAVAHAAPHAQAVIAAARARP